MDELVASMQYDKKTLDGRLRLVLPGAEGVDIVTDVPEKAVKAAWHAVGAGS